MPEELFGYRVVLEENPSRLVLSPPDSARLVHYQLEMITGNCIPGLLQASIRRQDEHFSISYDNENYISLGVYLKEQGITKAELLLFINQLKNIIKESRKFFLEQDSFILIDSFIYVKKGMREIALVYIPAGIDNDLSGSLKNLIICAIAHSADAEDPAVASFLRSVREGGVNISTLDHHIRHFFILDDVREAEYRIGQELNGFVQAPADSKKWCTGVDGSAVSKKSERKLWGLKYWQLGVGLTSAVVVMGAVMTLVNKNLRGLDAAAGLFIVLGSSAAVTYIYFKTKRDNGALEDSCGEAHLNGVSAAVLAGNSPDEVTLPNEGGPKGLIPVIYKKQERRIKKQQEKKRDQEKKDYPALRNAIEGKEDLIIIDKDEFFIGSNSAVADYSQSGDKGVEKLHAMIIRKETGYHIIDLDTRSGTWVNGKRIASHKLFPIKNRDTICLAEQEFVFEKG